MGFNLVNKHFDVSVARFDNALKKIATVIGAFVLNICVVMEFGYLRGIIPQYVHWYATQYPATFDRFLLGCDLNPVIQHVFRMHQLNFVFTDLWFTYFLVFIFSIPVVCLLRPASSLRYAVAFVMVLMFGLLIYAIIPTAPPWMVLKSVSRLNVSHLPVLDTNPTAAMPSVHLAITSLVGFIMWESRHIGIRILGSLYVLLMAFGLLYLGEHFLLDLIVGFALGILCWKLSGEVLRRCNGMGKRLISPLLHR